MKFDSKRDKKLFYTIMIAITIAAVILLFLLIGRIRSGKTVELPYDTKENGIVLDPDPVIWEDGIYGTASNEGNEEEDAYGIVSEGYELPTSIVAVDDADFSPEIGAFCLLIRDYFSREDYQSAYELLSQETLDSLGKWYTEEEFQTYIETQKEKTGYEEVDLVYHESSLIGDHHLCKLSLVGITEGNKGNVIFNYETAVDLEFTVYETEDGFSFLPFNISKFGVESTFGTSTAKKYIEDVKNTE